ncbi:MAG: RNA polymerase subunit sigma-70 [Planctomycetes bacterium]|nr:RNA polymerase subunit sigma-70 [Planctomycetota bacterium]
MSEPPGGEPPADDLYAAVERELHAIAARLLRGERADHTLQPTALLHEAWLRLADRRTPWLDRTQFVRAAAGTMRRVLVDHARARGREKRAGDAQRVTLATALLDVRDGEADLLVVDDLLRRLGELDPELAQIVELRVFGGLAHAEIAAALGCSLRSVERGWRLARAFLCRELGLPPESPA